MNVNHNDRVWTLDDEPCDLADLFEVNEFDRDQRREIEVMAPGEVLILGGGAGAEFVLKCALVSR